jgi:ribosome-binding factor A
VTKGTLRDLQLTHVVAEELNFILGGASDPYLSSMRVSEVQAGKGAGHFTVMLVPDESADGLPPAKDLKMALERAAGFVRAELAEALNLKRTPELTFVLDPRVPLPKA